MERTWTLLLSFALMLTSCGRSGSEVLGPAGQAAPSTITIQSRAFAEGAKIPKPFTCDGQNISPPLQWSGVPASAQSLALICDDPDAPLGTWTHWLLYNMPPDVQELTEALPQDASLSAPPAGNAEKPAQQGKNDFGNLGYGGPCPPGGTHHYHFKLYALNARLDLPPGATKDELLRVMKGHVLAQGKLVGTYSR
jgi:Raf kinase inhibitor-like YbhB/YbcL family protein